jgi:hypothetical protein
VGKNDPDTYTCFSTVDHFARTFDFAQLFWSSDLILCKSYSAFFDDERGTEEKRTEDGTNATPKYKDEASQRTI